MANNSEIIRSINRSLKNGDPIPIEHLHYVDIDRQFSPESIIKRKLKRKLDKCQPRKR